MKNILALNIAALILSVCSLQSNAATQIVNVFDDNFLPANFTINTGDTIMWMWDSNASQHTTTSTTIPSGAASWDHSMNQNSQSFMYVPTVTGSYNYHCSYHSMMMGHFTVLGSTGIADIPAFNLMSINVTDPATHEVHVNYSISTATTLNIRVYDLLGNMTRTLFSSLESSGNYSQVFALTGMRKGIYVIQLETDQTQFSRKILIQ